jgi:hypothetical protein
MDKTSAHCITRQIRMEGYPKNLNLNFRTFSLDSMRKYLGHHSIQYSDTMTRSELAIIIAR